MQRDYWNWHKRKVEIQNRSRLLFHERQVWFANLGENIGFEENGKGTELLRPIIVIKKFSKELLWAIPTTSKSRKGKYYFNFMFSKHESTNAILSQLRLIDSKRLKYMIGNITETDFSIIKERLISFLK